MKIKLAGIKNIPNILYWIVIALLILVTVATVLTTQKTPGGYRLFVVQSGSMEPTIKTGSIVLVVSQKQYKENDVVTFLIDPNAKLKDIKSTATHRIIKVIEKDKNINYTTKGDANKSADPNTINQAQVLGKVMITIPFVGWFIAFTKTQIGFIALIIIPSTLIIYSELMNIKKESTRLIALYLKKRKDKKKEETEKV